MTVPQHTIGIVSRNNRYARMITSVLNRDSYYRVIWTVSNVEKSARTIRQKQADIILIDCTFKSDDCVRVTNLLQSMCQSILLLITAEAEQNNAQVFDAMGAGALDILTYPADDYNLPSNQVRSYQHFLLEKLNTVRKLIKTTRVTPEPTQFQQHDELTLIAIGSSTGGPTALAAILSQLPPNLPAAITVVQHVNEQFVGNLAKWLNDHSALKVRLAEEGDQPTAGEVLIGARDDHLVLNKHQQYEYTENPVDYPYRPSVDVFFDSVARHWSNYAIGILLTGMGRDGANGLLTLRKKGIKTIAQNQESCTVFGMPKAAIEMNAAELVLDVKEMSKEICKSFDYTHRRKII